MEAQQLGGAYVGVLKKELQRLDSPSVDGPVRTCVGCRQRDARAQLLRLVLDETEGTTRVRPDVAGRLPGRGAWLHATPRCWELAVRRRAVGRALRAGAAVDTALVEAFLAVQADHVVSAVEATGTHKIQ